MIDIVHPRWFDMYINSSHYKWIPTNTTLVEMNRQVSWYTYKDGDWYSVTGGWFRIVLPTWNDMETELNGCFWNKKSGRWRSELVEWRAFNTDHVQYHGWIQHILSLICDDYYRFDIALVVSLPPMWPETKGADSLRVGRCRLQLLEGAQQLGTTEFQWVIAGTRLT